MNDLHNVLDEAGNQVGIVDFFNADKAGQAVMFGDRLNKKKQALLDQKASLEAQKATQERAIDDQLAKLAAVNES